MLPSTKIQRTKGEVLISLMGRSVSYTGWHTAEIRVLHTGKKELFSYHEHHNNLWDLCTQGDIIDFEHTKGWLFGGNEIRKIIAIDKIRDRVLKSQLFKVSQNQNRTNQMPPIETILHNHGVSSVGFKLSLKLSGSLDDITKLVHDVIENAKDFRCFLDADALNKSGAITVPFFMAEIMPVSFTTLGVLIEPAGGTNVNIYVGASGKKKTKPGFWGDSAAMSCYAVVEVLQERVEASTHIQQISPQIKPYVWE